jgi:hypothetical protein
MPCPLKTIVHKPRIFKVSTFLSFNSFNDPFFMLFNHNSGAFKNTPITKKIQ